ncbi:MAG: hypothetical protein QOG30_596 [Acidimicrobiaceae bacterium]
MAAVGNPTSASDSPLVSVVIPTRDRRELLQRSVESVLAQTVRDFECIVVDDGSTDGTHEWLASLDDPRVTAITLPEGGGAPHARNRGIHAARARFVAFLDSDDEWPADYLARMLPVFERTPRPCTVWAGVWRVEDGQRTPMVPRVRGDAFEELLQFDFRHSVISIVVDRDMAGPLLHFDETLPAHQDFDLLLALTQQQPVACVAEPLYIWHWHDGPRVSRSRSYARSRRMLIDKYADALAERPATAAHHWFLLARTYRTLGDIDGVRDAIAHAATLDPTNRRVRVLAWFSRRGRRSTVFAWRVDHQIDKALRRV